MKYFVLYKNFWIPVTKEEFAELPLWKQIINMAVPRKRKRDEELKGKFHVMKGDTNV